MSARVPMRGPPPCQRCTVRALSPSISRARAWRAPAAIASLIRPINVLRCSRVVMLPRPRTALDTFLQPQQRCRLRQCLLFTVQFALKLYVGMLQFAYFLGALAPASGPAGGAEVHAPLRKMMSKQPPFTAPPV